jgi:hypothetical protein
MITVDVRISRNLLTPALQNIRQQLQQLPKQLEQEMISLTPRATGNAKRRTRLVNNRRIEARYPYAQVLDKGRRMTNRGMRGSRQAPNGMTGPLRLWYRNRVRSMLRRKGR